MVRLHVAVCVTVPPNNRAPMKDGRGCPQITIAETAMLSWY